MGETWVSIIIVDHPMREKQDDILRARSGQLDVAYEQNMADESYLESRGDCQTAGRSRRDRGVILFFLRMLQPRISEQEKTPDFTVAVHACRKDETQQE